MPLRQLDRNELAYVDELAIEQRRQRSLNDLDNFYTGAKNAALSGAASTAGMLGDFESLVKGLMLNKSTFPTLQAFFPGATPRGNSGAPTSERLADMIGADLNSPSGWIGQIGVPDLTDIGKLGLVGYKGAMVLAHGSPHKFSKFSMNKIGTGEGAQAYGHGLYFAENPGVARTYIQSQHGSTGNWEWGGKTYKSTDSIPDRDGISQVDQVSFNVRESLNASSGDKQGALKKLDEWIADATYPESSTNQARIKAREIINKGELSGNLYEVDIPDEQIAKMLDWDAPLSEQPEILKVLRGNNKITADSVPRTAASVSLEEIGDVDPSLTGQQLIEKLTYLADRKLNNGVIRINIPPQYRGEAQKVTSEYLNGIGIPGIKYLDGTSRSAGEGTRNIVAFDDSMIKVLTRNGQPVK